MSYFRLFACLKNKLFDFVGRKESVAELKKVITTLHKEMSMMQEKLYDFKEASSAVHSLRAELHSMHAILERKVSLFTFVERTCLLFLDQLCALHAICEMFE